MVKVENSNGGDPGRLSASEDGKTDAYYFLEFSANKKNITLDLKSERGLATVKELAKKADVMIENLAPGTIERLGLGFDVIKAINPGIIYTQIKGFAVGSPYEKFLSFDMIGQATGGTMSITGKADCMPLKPGPTLGDTGTGMLATISILSALYKKKDTGEGQHIQLAMQDAMIQYCRTALSAQSATGKAAGRASAGSVTGGNAPMGLYPCKPGGPNGFVYVYGTCADNSHCHRVLETIGRPDLIDDERYDTPKKRAAAKPEIETMLIPWTQARTKEEAMISLGESKVPAGAVFDTMELRKNANMEERDIFQTVDHPTVGPGKIPVWPFEASGNDVPLKPAPLLGEHNEPVLTE